VVEAVPLPDDFAGGDVDLLGDAVEYLAVGRAAVFREVVRDRVVGGDQRRAAVGEPELMLVGIEPVARRDGGDLLVVLVEDHVLAGAVPGAARALADVEGQDRLAAVLLDPEVGRLVGQIDREKVEWLPLVVDDLGALLSRSAGGDDLWRREDVAGRGVAAVFQNADRWWNEVLRLERRVDPGDRDVGRLLAVAGVATG
jgi:hypothetical protein